MLAVGAPGNSGNNGIRRPHVWVYNCIVGSSVWTKLGNDTDGEADADVSGAEGSRFTST